MKKDNNSDHILSIGEIKIDKSGKPANIDPDCLPLLATRDLVLFPGVTFPISLGREASIAVAKWADDTDSPIGIVCQLNPETENPRVPDDLYPYGVVAMVVKIFDMPDGNKTAIIRALNKFKILDRSPLANMGIVPCAAVVSFTSHNPARATKNLRHWP